MVAIVTSNTWTELLSYNTATPHDSMMTRAEDQMYDWDYEVIETALQVARPGSLLYRYLHCSVITMIQY